MTTILSQPGPDGTIVASYTDRGDKPGTISFVIGGRRSLDTLSVEPYTSKADAIKIAKEALNAE